MQQEAILMIIPSSFKEAISNMFYDKTIELYRYLPKLNEDGGRSKNATKEKEEVATLLCNIQPTSKSLLKETYGLDIDASLLITGPLLSNIENGLLFQYSNLEYEVVDSLRYDSHSKIFARAL